MLNLDLTQNTTQAAETIVHSYTALRPATDGKSRTLKLETQ